LSRPGHEGAITCKDDVMRVISRSVLMTVCAATLLACGGSNSDNHVGAEGSPCYPNDTCDPGLTCLSTLCVRVVLGDGGGDTTDAMVAPGLDGGTNPDRDGATDGGATDGATSDATFMPAPHPALPQVLTLGGSVLVSPKVQPIVYTSDTGAPDIEAFLQELTHSSYWSDTTAEYGVGALEVLPAIRIASQAPAETTDAALRSALAYNTSGSNPAWGAANPNVIYLFVVPDGATVNVANSTCCSDFGGYHSEATSGSTIVPYAVGCACPGALGIAVKGLDERTTAISHELVETATDPFPDSNPAYQLLDRADIVWNVAGGEVGDMCAFNDDAPFVPPGSKYMVQRSWSNAAAKLTQNPCVPHTTTAPYFNSFPALDAIAYGDNTYITQGVHIPLGQSKTIDVKLFSSAATNGTWTVNAYDYGYWAFGAAPNLDLALDKSDGRNGDTIHLTITPQIADPDIGGEVFIIISHYGSVRDPDYQTNWTMALVTN
jgi:hypothetical protein